MNTKTIAATAAVIAASLLVLTGCTDGAGPVTPNQTTAPSEAPAQAGQIPEPESIGSNVRITVLEVIDPDTIRASLRENGENVGDPFIVHVAGIAAPNKGECGYDEALAFSTERFAFAGNAVAMSADLNNQFGQETEWVNADGEYTAILSDTSIGIFGTEAVEAGFALATGDGTSDLAKDQAKAESNNVGLWAICDAFGQ